MRSIATWTRTTSDFGTPTPSKMIELIGKTIANSLKRFGKIASITCRYRPNRFKLKLETTRSLHEVLGREHIQLIAPPKETRMRNMGGASIGR